MPTYLEIETAIATRIIDNTPALTEFLRPIEWWVEETYGD